MVISAGLRQCGTESRVHREWLVYSTQLFLFPAVLPSSVGIKIVRGDMIVIPVECHYHGKQKVSGEPLSPTWVPVTFTISVFGLLHFSLHIMADGCSFLRSSSVYQQGEAVFWEARVEAPEHSPLTVYVDSCVATLKPDPVSVPSYKFITKHGWCTTEGDSALCQCCDADCSDLSPEKNSGHTGHAPQPQIASFRHAHNSDGESCRRKEAQG